MPPDWSLYLVTDRLLAGERPLEALVAAAIDGGVTAVQLREKNASTRDFLELAKTLKTLLDRLGIPLIVNDRVDVALAAGASGVHIGQSDMPYADVRRLLGPNAFIGLSVESWEQVAEAERFDVNYLGVGPIFATETKPDAAPAWGLEPLSRLRQMSRHQLVAIGGIDAQNVQSVVRAGADGIAVVSAICAAATPRSEAHRLRRLIEEARRS